MAQEKKPSYEEAIARVEHVTQQVENGELSLDELNINLQEALKLIKSCKDDIQKTGKEIEKLLKTEINNG